MFAAILSVVLLLILAVLLYDFLPDFLNWFGRIKIGRITDDSEWINSVREVVIDWLAKGAPEVPKNENRRLRLIEKIKNRKEISPICYWQDAALLKAATEKIDDSAVECVAMLTERYIDVFTGEWKIKPERNDAAILAYEMLSNGYVDSKAVEPAMNTVAEMLREQYEKYGYIPYNKDIPEICFVDTVGMVCPFLIKYASVYKRPEFVNIAVKQIAQYRQSGFDDMTGFPYHCYNAETKARLGIIGWGRGCGWWAVGITDSLKELLKFDGMETEKTLLLRQVLSFLEKIEKNIGENGEVGRMLLNSSLPDSSTAAMLAYCFASVYSLTKKEKYAETAKKLFSYLKTATRRDGIIDYSQGDTMGIGYYSPGFSVVPAAQGFAAAAYELIYE